MKAMKRLMAALLAVVIMVSAAPMMRTKAATAPSTAGAKFISWEDYMDQTKCYIGVKDQNLDAFQYKVYDITGRNLKREGSQTAGKYMLTQNGQRWDCLLVQGTRKTNVTTIRLRVRRSGVWSAWSGLIAIIPIHTYNNVRLTVNADNRTAKLTWDKFPTLTDYCIYVSKTGKGGWWRAATTSGNSYTLTNFNGSKFALNQYYYVKVVGRCKINGKYVLAKGNRDDYAQYHFHFYKLYN